MYEHDRIISVIECHILHSNIISVHFSSLLIFVALPFTGLLSKVRVVYYATLVTTLNNYLPNA